VTGESRGTGRDARHGPSRAKIRATSCPDGLVREKPVRPRRPAPQCCECSVLFFNFAQPRHHAVAVDRRVRHACSAIRMRHALVTRDFFAQRPRDLAFTRLRRHGHPLTELRTVHKWGLSGVGNRRNEQRKRCDNEKEEAFHDDPPFHVTATVDREPCARTAFRHTRTLAYRRSTINGLRCG
jgi:hypothetical protein